MDTTNSSETPQRRVEDRKPEEVIDWAAPGAPAVPLSPAATSGTDDFMVYGRAGNRRADLEAKLRDALAADTATASGDELPRPDCTYADHSYPAYSAKLVRKIRDEARAAVSAATKPTADSVMTNLDGSVTRKWDDAEGSHSHTTGLPPAPMPTFDPTSPVPIPFASTTGAAQTVDQVRNQALEEAAKTAEATRVAQVQYGLSIFQDGDGTRDDIATAIRALKSRPTPTHSSEAGDA